MKRTRAHALVIMVLLAGWACAPASAGPLEILAPAQKTVVHDNAGNLAVEVKVDPPLDPASSMTLRILLDDSPAAPESTATRFALHGVERGQHRLQVVLLDRLGQTLAVSNTTRFTMWQASIRNPPHRTN